jgi:hypothetical protein
MSLTLMPIDIYDALPSSSLVLKNEDRRGTRGHSHITGRIGAVYCLRLTPIYPYPITDDEYLLSRCVNSNRISSRSFRKRAVIPPHTGSQYLSGRDEAQETGHQE